MAKEASLPRNEYRYPGLPSGAGNRQLEKNFKKSYQKTTRREWMKYSLLGGAGFLVSAGYLSFEAQWLEVQEKEIQLKHLHPKANIRVLHLSDLHLSKAVSLKYLENALKLGLDQSPDLCIITGDFITDRPGAEKILEYGKLLGHFAAKVPTFACLGNHDGGTWSAEHGGFSSSDAVQDLLRSAKIKLLLNEKHEVFIKGQKIDLVGLGDLWSEIACPIPASTAYLQAPQRKEILFSCSITTRTPRMH